MGTYSVELNPVGTRPNPMNAGQVVKFQTTAEMVQECETLIPKQPRTWGISDLPEERVTLVVYGSGGREVKRVTSDAFGTGFWHFDCKHPDRVADKWKRRLSRWRRILGFNLFDRTIIRPLRPKFHIWRVKRADARFMREIMKTGRT